MKMELKDALEFAIHTLEGLVKAAGPLEPHYQRHAEAARLLRDGSEKVEHVETLSRYACNFCGEKSKLSDSAGSAVLRCRCWRHNGYTKIPMRKTYTTHHEIKIIEVTSDPVFVEIGDEG